MRFIRDAFDWGGLTGRGGFALAAICLLVVLLSPVLIPPLGLAGAAFALFAACATLLFWGHARRRLRDMGWSGWLLWLLLVPFVSLVLVIAMIIKRPDPEAVPGPYNRTGLVAVCIGAALMASRIAWAPYIIPSASMTPTLQTGDYALATRSFGTPERGDVVVFRHPLNGFDFIKRVIGLPGDTVQMQAGQVVLNGTPLRQEPLPDWTEPYVRSAAGTYPRCVVPVTLGETCAKSAFAETLPSGRTYRVLDLGPGPADETEPVEVPEGHVLVLGDNRDNSIDGRFPQSLGGVGFVPISNIAGRMRLVIYSQEGREGRVLRTVK